LSKTLFAAVSAVALFGAVAASAQGLPFSSDSATQRPWSVNRMPPRDMNVFHGQTARVGRPAASADRLANAK
jgi:hypothetical protein